MSTPIPHFRNFKGNGLDPRQNSRFEFSTNDFIFPTYDLNFTAEFKNYTVPVEFTSLENVFTLVF